MSPTSYRTAPPRVNLDLTLVGLGRFELPTSRLSGVRSNQLSYRPSVFLARRCFGRKKEPHFRGRAPHPESEPVGRVASVAYV